MHRPRIHTSHPLASDPFTIQLRTKVTKAKKHKRAKILGTRIDESPVVSPPQTQTTQKILIPEGRHVINSMSRRGSATKNPPSFDPGPPQVLQMKEKISKQQIKTRESIRFNFTGLQMSDRVRQLLNLSNGSQSEVMCVIQ
ncbi:hypothetical protein ACHAWO_010660 [Cyclotella atomus]|uniref:Uncharacterized protein n=1 Tax=Cyclotella atomus TaxID=382360 RepID=A0ABD3QRS7_9STRA